MKVAQVIVSNIGLLDYLIEGEIPAIGSTVTVPFKSKKTIGIVAKILNSSEISIEKLKPIEKKTSLNINQTNLEFISWVANYYIYNIGLVMKMAIPSYINNYLLKDKKTSSEDSISSDISFIPPNFSAQQIETLKKIENILTENSKSILIDGVTGSGKTEIYIAAAAKILENQQDSQVLIMLPEISLTSHVTDRILKRFNYKPLIWHSGVSDSKKRTAYFEIVNGKARIIVGARSALFLPFKNLKMIIVDEEHDHSYKQEDGVTYQARDMAIMRAKLANIPIILASASPSIESIQNCALGKIHKISLSSRYNNQNMPQIEIIDMKKEKRNNNSFISPTLASALRANLNKNEQSLLFLNRKGYSPMLICKDCGTKINCKHCSASLVYHKAQKKLKCHQCGYVAAIPKNCYNCNSSNENFTTCGPGIEKILEEVEKLFPEAKTLSLTQESFINLDKAKEILNAISNNEFNIIIGTQIIAKGHHFPSLTLVGIIDADIGIISGDLRSTEKNFQLLQQVGGRAGRELSNSKIYLQTFNPDHPMIQALVSYKRDTFFKEEIQNRKVCLMPPFGRLAALILSSKYEDKLSSFANNLIKAAPISKDIKVLGPAPALMYKLRDKYRQRILIKTQKNINIQKYIIDWLRNVKIPSNIHLKIDIDPYHFL